MVIFIVLVSIILFAIVWCALIASGRANEKESEYQTFSRDDDE